MVALLKYKYDIMADVKISRGSDISANGLITEHLWTPDVPGCARIRKYSPVLILLLKKILDDTYESVE